MRIAIISDIHSNLEALQTAFNHIDKNNIDRIICLGDIVGYGPDPSLCLTMVREKTNLIIMGNHDEVVFNVDRFEEFNSVARSAIEWTIKALTDEEKSFLHSLPYTISGDDLLFVHSTPKFPEKWDYVFSGFEARLYNNSFKERICFVGHSHLPGVYPMNPRIREYNTIDRFLINVGSIGQPRDGDPRLSYGVLDTVAGSYENVRLEYDIQETAWKILKRGLPRYLAERLFVGR